MNIQLRMKIRSSLDKGSTIENLNGFILNKTENDEYQCKIIDRKYDTKYKSSDSFKEKNFERFFARYLEVRVWRQNSLIAYHDKLLNSKKK